jgi:imidazoleglycerol phosphate dehydratase HisB
MALGDKKGIMRAGYFVMAMDETLAVAAVDLSGRVAYVVDDQVTVPLVGISRRSWWRTSSMALRAARRRMCM